MIKVGVAALVSGNYVFVKIETEERITGWRKSTPVSLRAAMMDEYQLAANPGNDKAGLSRPANGSNASRQNI